MRKFFIALAVVIFSVSAVHAEDRVTLEGSLAVRGWDSEDFDGSEGSWWSQRLRVGGKIAVADNVSAHFRMDLGEGIWGLDYSFLPARPGANPFDYALDSKIEIDRAYLQIDMGTWALLAGQQYLSLGIAQVFDTNATGLVMALDYNPITVALVYAKLSERASVSDEGDLDDLDGYAVNVAYAGNGFNSNVFYVKVEDGTCYDFSPWALGFNGSTKVGIVDLTGELAFLGGDSGSGELKTDYSGTQLYLGAEAPITDRLNLGAEFMYAKGTDDDEVQLTTLATWNTFSPMSNNTPMSTEFSALPQNNTAFDPFGVSGGVIAGTVYADFTVNELLSLGCKLGYFEPEDSGKLESADLFAYNMWVKYQLTSNTFLSGTYMSASADGNNGEYDAFPEDKKLLVGELVVTF